ncbi:hypothetical protein RRF57_001829 [Xylaria bambusicola]|uniref:Uncharacterized protein n=1 Tax=Xylaria bambusicola TaxID=326684 RepID=A0AAN7UHR8_9PEZI
MEHLANGDEYPTSDEITNGVLFTSQRKGWLVVYNTGMLGMSCPYAKIGNNVCLLAGCSSAVVLRGRHGNHPNISSPQTTYEVVGIVSIHLSEKDDERWTPFPSPQKQPMVENGVSWYETKMHEYRQRSAWQEFILV